MTNWIRTRWWHQQLLMVNWAILCWVIPLRGRSLVWIKHRSIQTFQLEAWLNCRTRCLQVQCFPMIPLKQLNTHELLHSHVLSLKATPAAFSVANQSIQRSRWLSRTSKFPTLLIIWLSPTQTKQLLNKQTSRMKSGKTACQNTSATNTCSREVISSRIRVNLFQTTKDLIWARPLTEARISPR